MSGRKREPVAEIGAEDYLIVKYTHDIDLARELMTQALVEEAAWPGDPYSVVVARRERIAQRLARPKATWVQAQPVLLDIAVTEQSWQATYHCSYDQPGPSVFPAVMFL